MAFIEQLRKLEKKLPNLLCGIGGIAELINKVKHGIQILRILKFLICHRVCIINNKYVMIFFNEKIELKFQKKLLIRHFRFKAWILDWFYLQ